LTELGKNELDLNSHKFAPLKRFCDVKVTIIGWDQLQFVAVTCTT